MEERKIKVIVTEHVDDYLYKQIMVHHYTLKQNQSFGLAGDSFSSIIFALFNASGDYPKEKWDDAYEVVRALMFSATIYENGYCGEDIDDINMGYVLKDVADMFRLAFDRGNDFSIYIMMDE